MRASIIRGFARTQPGGRPAAPRPLALVQAFVNTQFDLGARFGGEVLHSPAPVGHLSAVEAVRLAVTLHGRRDPTSRLDRASAARAIRLLDACAAAGHTVICATHDPEAVAAAQEVLELATLSAAVNAGWTMPGSHPFPPGRFREHLRHRRTRHRPGGPQRARR